MVLDAEDWMGAVAQSGDGLVVEIEVGNFDFGRERIGSDGKAMVLGGDADFPALQILDRLIGSAMTELELEGATSKGEGDDLMTETDAEDWELADQGPNGLVGVGEGGGVTRAIGEEETVWLAGEDFGWGGGGGEEFYLEAMLAKETADIFFHAEVEGDDAKAGGGKIGKLIAQFIVGKTVLTGSPGYLPGAAFPVLFIPDGGLRGGDFPHKIAAFHWCTLARLFDGSFGTEVPDGKAALHGTALAQVFGQGTGVHSLDGGNSVFLQVVMEGGLGSPVADDWAEGGHNEATNLRSMAFLIEQIGSGIADFRVGHGHDLPPVRRIGQNFLVTGHGSIETNFAGGGADRTKALAVKNPPVAESEQGGWGGGIRGSQA